MTLQIMAMWGFGIIGAIILGFAAVVLWKVFKDKIKIDDLLVESAADGSRKASLSRFQFLIFTFVFAGLFLMLSIEAGTFVDIPNNVLALLGISSGSYVVSKAVAASGKAPTGGGSTDTKAAKDASDGGKAGTV